jgi:hypothetical protein
MLSIRARRLGELEREMNRIVRSNYPAARLSEDLRNGLDPSATVTVLVTVEESSPTNALSLEEIFSLRKPPYRSRLEIDTDISRERDKWDG